MANTFEYAQLSGRVYDATRPENRTPVPLGWSEIEWAPDTTTGFSAGAYTNGNEIVISFTGTNQAKLADFTLANIPLALGLPSPQLGLAVQLYERIKAENPGVPISFTGHSLGGGLASLMAVFFDKPAYIFDPAPFGNSAFSLAVLASVAATLLEDTIVDGDFLAYVNPLQTIFEYARRVSHVTGSYLQGEALQPVRALPILTTAASNLREISTGNTGLGAINLHRSVELLELIDGIPAFASVSGALPSLLPLIFDSALFDLDDSRNLLAHLYRHQLGVYQNTPEAPQLITPDHMAERFAADLQKISQLSPRGSEGVLVDGLITLALQHYYQQDTTQASVFTSLAGGVQFDLATSLGDVDTALSDIKGYAGIKGFARDTAYLSGQQALDALNVLVEEKHRWSVGLGTSPFSGTTQGDDVVDVVLGNDGGDYFNAGGGNDLLIQEVVKAEAHEKQQTLVSPVDGVVQQLAVHTVGGVVTPAQTLMVVAPSDYQAEVEAVLENKDVGFVKIGQPAEVKIETFPFTRYGTLRGTVSFVSTDAVADEKKGLVFQARVKLDRAVLRVDEREVALTPGMAVSAEIATGRRRVIGFFLDPIRKTVSEGLRER